MPRQSKHIPRTEAEIRAKLAELEALRHLEEVALVAQELDVDIPKYDSGAAAEKLILDECDEIQEFSSSRLESAISRFNS